MTTSQQNAPLSEFKSWSERVTGEMLRKFGLTLVYEQPHGSKHPEFSAYDRFGQLRAVIEVKDICWKEGELDELSERLAQQTLGEPLEMVGYDPTKRPRRLIRDAMDQLAPAASVPTMAVIHDSTKANHLTIDAMAEALLGDVKIIVPYHRDGEPGESYVAHRGNGRFTDPRWRTQMRTVSAVSILRTDNVEQHSSGYLRELRATYKSKLYTTSGALSADIFAHTEALEQLYRRRGVDLDRIEPRLVIFRNPFARIAWPLELIGEFDEVWDLDRHRGRLSKTIDGLASA